MANPLYDALGGQNVMMNMLNQYKQFRANFHGDPQAEVQKLLNSGRISQQQYNSAVQMAQQIQRMMKM